jgi:hypothetical protein
MRSDIRLPRGRLPLAIGLVGLAATLRVVAWQSASATGSTARLLMVVGPLASILATYWLARMLFGPGVGLTAAWFHAVLPGGVTGERVNESASWLWTTGGPVLVLTLWGLLTTAQLSPRLCMWLLGVPLLQLTLAATFRVHATALALVLPFVVVLASLGVHDVVSRVLPRRRAPAAVVLSLGAVAPILLDAVVP